MDKEKILQEGTEYANKHWNVSETPNEHDNAREDFINGALWVVKNCPIPLVSESSELAKAKEERDQYKKLWQQSQRLKRELIEKYNLPIAKATLD